jgi:hypothetical protein
MGLFSRKNQPPDEVRLPLPELEEPEPAEEDEEPSLDPPRVVKLDAADAVEEPDPLSLLGTDAGGDVPAPAPQAQPADKDDLLSMFGDVNYVDPVVEHLLARVRDVTAEDLLLEAREVRLQLKGALPAGPAG